MPGDVDWPGTRRLSWQRTVRVLDQQTVIDTDCAEINERLGYVEHSARHPVAAARTSSIAVLADPGGYRLVGPGAAPVVVERPRRAVEWCYRQSYFRVFKALAPDAVLLHGVVAGEGRPVVICGDAGAGKSTLAVRLLLAGVRVDGDEYAVLRPGTVEAAARNFHIKSASLPLIPEVRAIADSLPSMPDLVTRSPVYALDVNRLRPGWVVEPAPLGAFVVAVPRHGGLTTLDRIPCWEAIRRATPQLLAGNGGHGAAVAALTGAVSDVPCFALTIGDLPTAVLAVRRLAG